MTRRTRPRPLQTPHDRLGAEPAPLTLAQARRDVAALGLRIQPTGWNDYRVHWPKDRRNNEAGYFTNDLQDAIDTARAMASERAAA